MIFVRKSKDKETFSAPDFLTLYYRSSPFEMSSIYEAANRNRNFSIAFFSIRDTYERLMPSRAATCFCVYSAFPPRPYRRRSTCFSCSLIPNPDNSTAAPRPLSGCTVPRYPPRRPPRCRADGSHFPPCRFRSARRGKSPVPFSFAPKIHQQLIINTAGGVCGQPVSFFESYVITALMIPIVPMEIRSSRSSGRP